MERRKSVFAGSWYPDSATACDQQIARFLDGPLPLAEEPSRWLAGIVPHAGWYYSGRIACQVIHLLREPEPLDLVVVFGMHLHPGSANYMMASGAWQTPYGDLPVAESLAGALQARFDFQVETPQRFNQDNTVELQLPFIKKFLDPVEFLAVGVPPAERSLAIGRYVVDWARENQKRLKIIGSTDLTHYGANYGFSPQGHGVHALAWVRDQNDRQVIDAMLAMAPEAVIRQGLECQNACCAGAAATAIAAAKQYGAVQARSVAYATSYEKSPGDSFVGYVGVVMGA